MNIKSWFHFIILITLDIALFSLNNFSVSAQENYQWSPPQRIPDYGNLSLTPYLVADQNRTVHAFNTQPVDISSEAIFYRKWTVDGGWTSPVDILLSPRPEAPQVQGVTLDRAGWLNLIFFSGNELDGAIYYSKAPAINAGRASAWSVPTIIGKNASSPRNAVLVGNGGDYLICIYSGSLEGRGLYAVDLSDGGDLWSDPYTIYLTLDDQLYPYAIQTILDNQERLHVVWTIDNNDGNGEAVYYVRLEFDHTHWSKPFILATAIGYEADWGSIVSYEGQLIVIFDNSEPATRWMRMSFDNGDTWTRPVRPFPHVGEYRQASFVIDSNNVLHMLLGNRMVDPEIHGMWHCIWLGDHWSELDPVVSGTRVVSNPGGSGFDPTDPRAVVSQGNVLLVTWSTDPGAGFNGVWYSYALLNTPELQPATLANPLASPSQVSGIITTPQITPTSPASLPEASSQSNYSTLSRLNTVIMNPGFPVSISILLVILLIVIVLTVTIVHQTSNNQRR